MCKKNSSFIFPMMLIIIMFLTYQMSIMQYNIENSDTFMHIQFGKQWIQGTYALTYPVWHLVVLCFMKFSIPEVYAAAYANALFAFLCAAVIYYIFDFFFQDKSNSLLNSFLTVIVLFFGPIYVPYFNVQYYLGQGMFNTWHNPTNNAVRFLALGIVFLFVYADCLEDTRKVKILNKDYNLKGLLFIVAGILLFLSTFIKPSFAQMFLPAAGIFLLLDLIRKRKSLFTCIKIGMVLVPTGLVFLYQYFILFASEDATIGGMVIALFQVWNYWSPNPILSILLGNAFSFFIILIFIKEFCKDKYFLMAILCFICAVLEYSIFSESGSRLSDGNFGWAYNLSVGILFLFSIIKFFHFYFEYRTNTGAKLKIFIGSGLLMAHFLWGIWYYQFLMGQNIYQCF